MCPSDQLVLEAWRGIGEIGGAIVRSVIQQGLGELSVYIPGNGIDRTGQRDNGF